MLRLCSRSAACSSSWQRASSSAMRADSSGPPAHGGKEAVAGRFQPHERSCAGWMRRGQSRVANKQEPHGAVGCGNMCRCPSSNPFPGTGRRAEGRTWQGCMLPPHRQLRLHLAPQQAQRVLPHQAVLGCRVGAHRGQQQVQAQEGQQSPHAAACQQALCRQAGKQAKGIQLVLVDQSWGRESSQRPTTGDACSAGLPSPLPHAHLGCSWLALR